MEDNWYNVDIWFDGNDSEYFMRTESPHTSLEIAMEYRLCFESWGNGEEHRLAVL